MEKRKYLFKDYSKKLFDALERVEQLEIEKLLLNIQKIIGTNANVFLLGNGGSQANAHHVSGDFIKTFSMAGLKLKISCLADNVCHLTAASNDVSFEDSYAMLINNIIDQGDLIIYLSGSGNSLNLVKCARKAKSRGIKQASITGFNGGALKEIVDIPIHINIDDMEIAEDIQLSIFHYIKQRLIDIYEENFSNINASKYSKRTLENLIS
tara:strand:+ start:1743 stop:2372 length:630 start_codon:yes stop_codon:yes gene_type:complete